MKKLISMSDFVLEESKLRNEIIDKAEKEERIDWMIDANNNYIEKTEKYANFLKQPLTLGMFLPCKLVDGVWVVLEEPNIPFQDSIMEEGIHSKYSNNLKQYQEAKERVLFEGFELITDASGIYHVKNKDIFIGIGFKNARFKKIEELVNFQNWTSNQQIELTQSAIKQIGL